MNITNVSCPNCAASLTVPGNSKSMIYCQFCGASVYLETAHNTGYDLEMGRREAIANTADNFVAMLQEIRGPLLELPQDYRKVKACETAIKNCENNIIKYNKPSTPYVIPSIVSGSVVLFLCMIRAPFIVFLLAGVLCLGGYILRGQACVSNAANAATLLEKKKQELISLNETVKYKEGVATKYPGVNIPQKYQNDKAFDYFINLFKSRQAFTLEEAYSRYEEVLKQEEALQLQRQQIELQQKQIQQMQQMQRQMQQQNRRRR